MDEADPPREPQTAADEMLSDALPEERARDAAGHASRAAREQEEADADDG